MQCVTPSLWSVALVLVVVVPAVASPPTLVSPVGETTTCPTFSWAASVGEGGHELVIYEVSDTGEISALPVTKVALPGRASSWSLPADSCLAPGGRYAWSMRTIDAVQDGEWAVPVLLTVRSMPSEDEVQQALDVLRRYREGTAREGGAGEDPFDAAQGMPVPSRAPEATPFSDDPAAQDERRPGGETAAVDIAPTSAGVVAPNPDTEPRSLSVDSNIELGASSNLFKDGKLLLWTDTLSATTAIGEGALASTNADSTNDTAVGYRALTYSTGMSGPFSQNTAVGAFALFANTTGHFNTALGAVALGSNTTGRQNTAVGALALHANTGGTGSTAVGYGALKSSYAGLNTAVGQYALFSHTSGGGNTAVGAQALQNSANATGNTAMGYSSLYANVGGGRNTAIGWKALRTNTGHRNTAIGAQAIEVQLGGVGNTAMGYRAGSAWSTGSYNIAIGEGVTGTIGDESTIRIGSGQTQTYIAGIWGNAPSGGALNQVFVTSTGELGTTTSSARFKSDIQDLEGFTARLMNLRPVSFHYRRSDAESGDAVEPAIEFGLIAEEVAAVVPELVIYDEEGKPYTVRYHLLTPLLLAEIQRQEQEIRKTEAELATVQRRLDGFAPQGLAPRRADQGDRFAPIWIDPPARVPAHE